MATSYNFRSALNGFNREDVVHYIEFINSKHANQLNQLKSDLSAAQAENTRLRTKPERAPELEAKTAELAARVAQLENEFLASEQARAALEAELAAVTKQRDEALNEQAQIRRRNEEELEAYRRAERIERQARERTESMYQQANGILADATAKVDDASIQIAGIANQVAAQLAVLQDAITGSKGALRDAAATLYTLRPDTDN